MKKTILILLLAGFSGYLFAQDGNSTKITIFQPGSTSTVTASDAPREQNLVKWNYSVASRGVFLMNYEFIVTDKITGEVGFGLTYRDFIYEALQNDRLLEYKNPNVNFALEGGIRFYPKGNNHFEGIYLSPTISYRKYSFDPQVELYGSGDYAGYDASFNPGYSFLDSQFKFGYQYESYWLDDVTTDFYIGFGYRQATSKYYELYQVNTAFGGSQTEIRAVSDSDAFPQFLLGFKLGIAF